MFARYFMVKTLITLIWPKKTLTLVAIAPQHIYKSGMASHILPVTAVFITNFSHQVITFFSTKSIHMHTSIYEFTLSMNFTFSLLCIVCQYESIDYSKQVHFCTNYASLTRKHLICADLTIKISIL